MGNAVYPAASPHAVFSTPVEMAKVAFKADCRSNNNATLTSLCEATARQGERRYKKGERRGYVAERIVRTWC